MVWCKAYFDILNRVDILIANAVINYDARPKTHEVGTLFKYGIQDLQA